MTTNNDSCRQLGGLRQRQQATAFGWRDPTTMMTRPEARAGATFPDIYLHKDFDDDVAFLGHYRDFVCLSLSIADRFIDVSLYFIALGV